MVCFEGEEGTITPQCAVTRVRPLLLQYHWDTLSFDRRRLDLLCASDDKNDHIACLFLCFLSYVLLVVVIVHRRRRDEDEV